ncbi:kelch motif protein (macronuclear) [Tetrahymena thermophila SB210]|uniref:Kelch motif protein n=1 Tax=Tetrahymena thermophila (strain SB210) TaxID=312017 RepID=I7M6D5_TETTS|nr:kelch motif protein [Tetrahymena thermophila SB210]EAR85007.2 kelch motif protein [Tetrahymena thermophila SB210]|eukprot:XP_001032670.2 kelch motif protein [Tetrahymena thermophila SB210]
MSQTAIDKVNNNCHQQLECKQLRRAVKWICLHPLCNSFLEMCDSCYPIHIEFHKQNKLFQEADFQNPLNRLEQQKDNVNKILIKVQSELQAIREKINQEIQSFAKQESPPLPIVQELTSVKDAIIKLFDDLIDKLQEESHLKKRDMLRAIHEEVTTKITETLEYQNMLSNPETQLQSMRDVIIFDLEYQTQIQRSRMEQVLDELAIKNDERKIDEDVVLRIISSVRKDIEQIILKPSNIQTQKQNIKKQIDNSQQCKNWLFYFEPYTKNFHYLNVQDSNPTFKTHTLAIDFLISPGNRSILAKDNQIYLVGGYDPKQINLENEQQYKYVYKLNLERLTLSKVSSLITLRHSFGLCQLQNYLYVVGGYNYIEGSLAKCEKIPLDNEAYNSSIPINNLQKRSCYLTVCSWRNSILVKYGGILHDQSFQATNGKQEQQIVLSDYLTEFYLPDQDFWVQMQTLNYPCTFLSNSIEINGQIIIFGGITLDKIKKKSTSKNEDKVITTNSLIKIKAYNVESLDIEISKSSSVFDPCYSMFQPLLKETSNSKKKRIYFLAQDNLDFKNHTLKPFLRYFDI